VSTLSRLVSSVVQSLLGKGSNRQDSPAPSFEVPRGPVLDRPAPQRRGESDSPGQFGSTATTDATGVDGVRMAYNPETDGDPDPGEIVWTWVPYEENDGRGKDRPVLVVARETGRPTVLAVQLSSQDHSRHDEWVSVGVGQWDSERRPSWADTDRVLRVHPDGMRREGATLARDAFDRVAAALKDRYGWSNAS
jgi:hypothetical protein